MTAAVALSGLATGSAKDETRRLLGPALDASGNATRPLPTAPLAAPVPILPQTHVFGGRSLKHDGTKAPEIEIVVAHYREDLRWLADHAASACIYDKGPMASDDSPEDTPWRWRGTLSNIGMESHTYLSHLARRYHHLADITLFTQAGIQETVENFQGIGPMLEQSRMPSADVVVWRMPDVFRRWDGMVHTYKWLEDYKSGVMRPAGMKPGEFWRFAFGPGSALPPKQVNYIHEATFAVHRHAIRRRPQEFYAKLLSYFEALNHTNPEEGHYMERLWLPIFAGPPDKIVHMPSGQHLPVIPEDHEVNFWDHATDGKFIPHA